MQKLLHEAGIQDDQAPPDAGTWRRFLDVLNRAYEARRLESVTHRAAGVDENADTSAALRPFDLDMATLHYVNPRIAADGPMLRILRLIVREMANLLLVEGCVISEWDSAAAVADVLAILGPPDWLDGRPTTPAGRPLTNPLRPEANIVQRTVNQPGIDPLQRQYMRDAGLKTILRVPLLVGNTVTGLVELEDRRVDRVFTDVEIALAQQLVEQIATVIDSSQERIRTAQHVLEMEARVIERTTELHRVKEHVEAILNNSSDAIALAYPDGTIRQCNPAFDNLLNFDIDEAFGRSVLSLVAAGHMDAMREALDTVANEQRSVRLELPVERGSGITFDADVALSPVSQTGNHISGIIFSLRDISARKQEEERLRHALERERQLGELKVRFASMISHEFRTPLATIQSASDLLKTYHDRLRQERKAELLNTIQSQIKQLDGMLDDILMISKAQSVGLEFSPADVDLVHLCADVFDEMRLLATPQHDLVFDSAETRLPAFLDERLTRRMFINLLSNAIKYSPQGGRVRFALWTDADGVIIRVEDEGIGIPADDQQHLFETFHRAKNAGTISGTGLGLVIVKHIVELHSGTVHVKSDEDVGTTFTIRLPLPVRVAEGLN